MIHPYHSRSRRHPSGYTLMAALGLIVLIGLAGSLMTIYSLYDMKQSKRDFTRKKADYMAEAAMNWGLALMRVPPTYTCATHDSSGANADTTGGPGCTWATPFTDSSHAWYPGTAPVRSMDGWIANAPVNASDALTGELNESMAIKIWFPNDTTVRITGRGMAAGVSSNINLFGKIDP